jgi:hypothetical protein
MSALNRLSPHKKSVHLYLSNDLTNLDETGKSHLGIRVVGVGMGKREV